MRAASSMRMASTSMRRRSPCRSASHAGSVRATTAASGPSSASKYALLRRAPPMTRAAQDCKIAGKPGGGVAQSILVAEDERNLVEALSFLMQRAGYEVHVARDGPSTVEMARRLSPDLVLLDIMLPGFDGFEVVEAIRREPGGKRPRIIMLTAKGHEKDRRRAL